MISISKVSQASAEKCEELGWFVSLDDLLAVEVLGGRGGDGMFVTVSGFFLSAL